MTDDKQRKKKELAMAKHESEHQIKLNRVFNYVKADMIGTIFTIFVEAKFLFSSRRKLPKST